MSRRRGSDDNPAPPDPAEYRPKPLMGVGFWALIALSVLCVLAGVAVATLAPKLLPAGPQAPTHRESRAGHVEQALGERAESR